MKKSVSVLLSAASVVTLVGVALAQAQSTENLINVNAGDVPTVVNINVPPVPTLYSNDNSNVPPVVSLPVVEPRQEPLPPVNVNAGENRQNETPANPPMSPTTTPGTMTTSTGVKLIKVAHPNLLKYFREIRQIGNDLFGIPIPNSTAGQSGQTATGNAGTSSASGDQTGDSSSKPTLAQKLEKILTPDLIKFYNVVKKEGNSLFGTLKAGVKLPMSKNGNQDNKPKPHPVVTSDVSACVIAAIKVKDQAIIDGATAHNASFGTAVSARGACQSTALASTDGQQSALEKCVKDFRDSLAQAKETLAKSQKDAWNIYSTALKACKPAVTSGGNNNANTNVPAPVQEIMVEDGGNQ